MILDPTIFKAYDIRAVYGKEIDKEGWGRVVRGTYTYLCKIMKKNRLVVNVSRDMRKESRHLYAVTVKTLQSMGAKVNALDLASTPHSYFALLHLGSDASFQITASHNPSGYSGLKCVRKDKSNVIKISGLALKDVVLSGEYVRGLEGGLVRRMKAPVGAEVKFAVSKVPKITRRFKLVADTANGMGVTYLKTLQEHVPLDIHYLNKELDGSFPNHLSDTLQHEYWTTLCQHTKKLRADFGIATDGDGDRLALVDEKGRFVPCSIVSCLVMDVMHAQEKADNFLVDIRSIMNAQRFARQLGATVRVTKVGHANITTDLQRYRADFGGESSGHYFFASSGGAENVIRVIVSVLYKLQETGGTLSALVRRYQGAHEAIETNFTLPQPLTKEAVFKYIANKHRKGKINFLDGISVDYTDYRMNIRGSNTEPLLRLNLEASSATLLRSALAQAKKDLVLAGAILKRGH